MTRIPTEDDHLPIYEDLVRERGDAVAEAQIAAAHTENQATELLTDGAATYRGHQATHHGRPHLR